MIASRQTWISLAASVAGDSHLNRGIPCQDASISLSVPRPLAMVCDGIGSAKLSHFGSQAVVDSLSSLIQATEKDWRLLLDSQQELPYLKRRLESSLIRMAQLSIENLANRYQTSSKDFSTTLNLVVAGKQRIFILKIGDGAILIRTREGVKCFLEDKEGEPMNQTSSVHSGGDQTFQSHLLPAIDTTGVLIFSDGSQEAMIAKGGQVLAPSVGALLDHSDEMQHSDLHNFLQREFSGISDDRSVALLKLVLGKN